MLNVVISALTLCDLVGGYQRSSDGVPSCSLKVQTILSSEMLVTTYKTARRLSPDDDQQDNAKFLVFGCVCISFFAEAKSSWRRFDTFHEIKVTLSPLPQHV
jgi:hypothetical protein